MSESTKNVEDKLVGEVTLIDMIQEAIDRGGMVLRRSAPMSNGATIIHLTAIFADEMVAEAFTDLLENAGGAYRDLDDVQFAIKTRDLVHVQDTMDIPDGVGSVGALAPMDVGVEA